MNDLPFARKSLGQHWLTNVATLVAMCDAAKVNRQDTVLEIGPGIGSLTKLLTERAGEVVAVELDETLATALERWRAANLQIVHGSILKFDLTTLPTGYKLVANIPYYLTSHLLRLISETPHPPSRAALLVQKEVAERVAATPGSMSLLSVSTQFYWHVELGRLVPARLFTPPPKVDSQILILQRRAQPLFPDVHPKSFFRLVKAGFNNRRKTLLNSLGPGLKIDKDELLSGLTAAGIDSQARPQTLSLQEWQALYEVFKSDQL